MIRKARERNQAAVGVAALALLCVIMLLVLFTKNLISGGTTYTARFTESAGLTSGSDVQLAGVKVGEVTSVELDGNRVEVEFRAEDVRLGDRTKVSIQIKSLLGDKHLQLSPKGRGQWDPNRAIPVANTDVPFDIPDALDEVTRATEKVDAKQLARSFQVLSDSVRGSPEHLEGTVDGLSQLSQTIAKRDEKLRELLDNTSDVSKVAADRDKQVRRLVADGNLLLAELQHRKESISSLLEGTQRLSDQVNGLISDNEKQLRPALAELNRVTAMLRRNQNKIGETVAAMAPYIRGYNNTVGTGRWFDGYLCGLLPPSISAKPLEINKKGCDLSRPAPAEGSGGGR